MPKQKCDLPELSEKVALFGMLTDVEREILSRWIFAPYTKEITYAVIVSVP